MSIAVAKLDLGALAHRINERHQAFETSCEHAWSQAFEAGVLLREAKAGMKHGEWEPWVAQHLRFGVREAQRYMRVAEHQQVLNATGVSHLGLEAQLRQISEPKPKRQTTADASALLQGLAREGQDADDRHGTQGEPATPHVVGHETPSVGAQSSLIGPGAHEQPSGDRSAFAGTPGRVWGDSELRRLQRADERASAVLAILRDEQLPSLSPYSIAETLRRAALEAKALAGVLDELAFSFER